MSSATIVGICTLWLLDKKPAFPSNSYIVVEATTEPFRFSFQECVYVGASSSKAGCDNILYAMYREGYVKYLPSVLYYKKTFGLLNITLVINKCTICEDQYKPYVSTTLVSWACDKCKFKTSIDLGFKEDKVAEPPRVIKKSPYKKPISPTNDERLATFSEIDDYREEMKADFSGGSDG